MSISLALAHRPAGCCELLSGGRAAEGLTGIHQQEVKENGGKDRGRVPAEIPNCFSVTRHGLRPPGVQPWPPTDWLCNFKQNTRPLLLWVLIKLKQLKICAPFHYVSINAHLKIRGMLLEVRLWLINHGVNLKARNCFYSSVEDRSHKLPAHSRVFASLLPTAFCTKIKIN